MNSHGASNVKDAKRSLNIAQKKFSINRNSENLQLKNE
jgi:hypothetical protein